MKDYILLFLQKDDLGITQNYRDMIFTAIAAMVYNALRLIRTQTEVK